ncbi:PTS sugar transporter subunit IIA [Buchananella hordeovulneris]|uniref:PTS sugar transporter subunit IIA n=1 Tax=Buchananella hordeovulneris TaxID=52770 RepID=UPI000F602274|nr:PTS glucose transporter subunit IIA [Buchananella hordeovulneris]MDO5081417.1 PTS glucose transporter subunit IIA [Buchananella hordeovulneris]RRD53391.1 PTS glucose transporter subunit IIA [Buchananella hordeovulneris]
MSLRLSSPLSGTIVALPEVPDAAFADELLGPTLAIAPSPGEHAVRAPCAGRVFKLHPHAFVLATADRLVLVHLGIDTLHLRGEGFTLHVAADDAVSAGQLLVTWDTAVARARGLSPLTPVVALDGSKLRRKAKPGQVVQTGDLLAIWP